jgi:broad specificity phosphatase PhoE
MPGLFLVRHAEPAITGVMLGWLDPGLSERGREQAAVLLPGVRWERVYSSSLRRARETAEMIARGAPVEVLEDLREISHGDWNGLTWAQVEARDPELAARKLADWRGVTAPNAEPWPEFAARVLRAMEGIRRGPRPAAIVAHAAVNQLIGNVNQKYGEVCEID